MGEWRYSSMRSKPRHQMEMTEYRCSMGRRLCGPRTWSSRSDGIRTQVVTLVQTAHYVELTVLCPKWIKRTHSTEGGGIISKHASSTKILDGFRWNSALSVRRKELPDKRIGQFFSLLYTNPKFGFEFFRGTHNTDTRHVTQDTGLWLLFETSFDALNI
jgi:hypothetical protein